MFSTAMREEALGDLLGRARAAGRARDLGGERGEFLAHDAGVESRSPVGPKTRGKKSGWMLPSITFASVTASGPPRR